MDFMGSKSSLGYVFFIHSDLVDESDDLKKRLFGSSSLPFLYQVNLLKTMHKEWNTVSLTVGADPTIGLRRERMGRDTVRLETAVKTISQEYLLEFTSEYGIPEALHPELPGPEDRIVDFPKGKNNRFFWVDERVFPTVVDWRTSAPKDGMSAENTYSAEAVRTLDTHRTPIQKQTERWRIRLQLQIRRIERSPLDFANEAEAADQLTMALEVPLPEDVPTTSGAPEAGQAKRVAATDPSAVTKSRKRGHDGVDVNVPPKMLRRDHADPRPTGSTQRSPLDFANEAEAADQLTMALEVPLPEDVPTTSGAPEAGQAKRVAATDPSALGMAFARPVPVPESAPADVSDPDPLSFANPRSSQGTAAAGDPKSKNASFASVVGSPEMARRDKRIQAREHEMKNLEALLEAEADMKKTTEEENVKLSQELENMRALFLDLQVSNNHLSQQVATLQEHVSGEEKLKAAFEEFKQYEDNRVEQRCAKMDVRLDALSIDFDEELYAISVPVPLNSASLCTRRHGILDAESTAARVVTHFAAGRV
nr:hypothetical protein [Tanacetum cinerariifolium]